MEFMVNKSQVNLRLPDNLIEALKEKSEEEGVSITALVTQLLKEDLGLVEPEASDDVSSLEQRLRDVENRLEKQERLLARLGETFTAKRTDDDDWAVA